MKPTVERLYALYVYDAISGLVTRRVSRGKWKADQRAGTLDKSNGYRQISVDGQIIDEHLIAWAMHTGAWPKGLIDHIDGQRDRNVFANLRDGTRQLNQQNMRRARADSASGIQGVGERKGRYWARLRYDGRQHYLGTFATSSEAHAAYIVAKRQHHAGCTL